MGEFSRLEAAHLLFEKLTRDLARLKSWPNDADMAFSFFVTADALVEWLYPGAAGEQQRERLHNEPLLRAVWDVASGASQLELKRNGGPAHGVLMVQLTGRAADKYGTRLSAVKLA